jgi:hypothetical protein
MVAGYRLLSIGSMMFPELLTTLPTRGVMRLQSISIPAAGVSVTVTLLDFEGIGGM